MGHSSSSSTTYRAARFDIDTITSIILSAIGAALLVLITTVAILLDGPALVHRGRRLVPAERLGRADEIGRIVYHPIARYFAGSLSIACSTAP